MNVMEINNGENRNQNKALLSIFFSHKNIWQNIKIRSS